MTCKKYKNKAVGKAVEILGSQMELARICGVRQQTVSYWLNTGRVPPKRVIQIERSTNRVVKRHELRPDIYPIEN